jgi:hypothetical protein
VRTKEKNAAYMRAYWEKNREKLNAARRGKARPKTPEQKVKYSLVRTAQELNTTPEQIKELEAEQGGVCAICGKPPKVGGRRLSVDHDHATGKIRGMLCTRCNTALGSFDDDIERITKAADYLRSRK